MKLKKDLKYKEMILWQVLINIIIKMKKRNKLTLNMQMGKESMIIAKSAVTNSRVLKLGNKCDNKSSKKKHRMLVNNVIEGKK